GASSGDDADQPSDVKCRGMCGQFVFPCPREYPAEHAQRKAMKHFIPEDFTKEEVGLIFKQAVIKVGFLPKLDRLHVFSEPHKKYNPATNARARHFHIIFRFKTTFAHLQISSSKILHSQGIHGHFSFNLVGYHAYLSYCLKPSAGKLLSDLDLSPWSWPNTVQVAFVDKSPPQMAARNEKSSNKGRKRVLMTFSEVTDAFIEGHVKCASDAWRLAKSRKVAGDDTLYNTLGAQDATALVAKVLSAWNCEAAADTLVLRAEFPLSGFVPIDNLHQDLSQWMAVGHTSVSLILSGLGGRGKTELACSLMSAICQENGFHFINKLDRLRDIYLVRGQGLVVDEACLQNRTVDDAKDILDLKKDRDVSCRNRDGRVPKGTPRIFSTNWEYDQFFPADAKLTQNQEAIRRRILWVTVDRDLRINAAPAAPLPLEPLTSDEEDVFGHGGQLLDGAAPNS
ncbi:unnamed protein product, partial [Symbiodinium natans]